MELLIRERLSAAFPDQAIVGEEFQEKSGTSEYSWIIDPVDGTRAYICGVPVWGVLMGLLHQGEPVAGFALQPFTGELFYGTAEGAWMSYRGERQPLRARTTKTLERALFSSTAPETLSAACAPHSPQIIAEQVLLMRSGMDCYGYCLLALGQLDIVADGLLEPHDILPLVPILRGAGATVVWEPTDDGKMRAIAACTPELHQQVLALLG